MSTTINLKYKSIMSSDNINRKIHEIYGSNGIISGFEISEVPSELKISIASGKIVILGAMIETSDAYEVSVPSFSSTTTFYVVLEYNHTLSTLTFIAQTNNIPNSNQLVIGQFTVYVGDSQVFNENISNDGLILFNNTQIIARLEEGTPEKATTEEAEAGTDDSKYMTSLKVLQSILANVDGNGIYYATNTSLTDSYTVTIEDITSYDQLVGIPIITLFTVANTAGATYAVNALAAKPLVRGTATALATGDIPVNKVGIVVYDGTSFQLLSQGENLSLSTHTHSGVYQPVGSYQPAGTYLTGASAYKVTVSASAPNSPTTGDLWIDTTL